MEAPRKGQRPDPLRFTTALLHSYSTLRRLHPIKKKLHRPASSAAAFSGEPKTIWLTDASAADGRMQLLEPFSFLDPAGKSWQAEEGAVINGASIPRALWTLVGSPYTGDYRRASVVHDVACADAGTDAAKRLAADKMFFHACRAGGCSIGEAIVFYIGVRIGALVASDPALRATTANPTARSPRLTRSALEEKLERDFREITERVLADGEIADPTVIERRFQEACATVNPTPVWEHLNLPAKWQNALASEEEAKWVAVEATCRQALNFWDSFLDFRSGIMPNGPKLSGAEKDRLMKIARAVSWVESRHGTGIGTEPARDPMQCGHPQDAWWKELNGKSGTGSRLTGGQNAKNYFAADLPAKAAVAASFPGAAAFSRLGNPLLGHDDPGFNVTMSYIWGVIYLVHRANTHVDVPAGKTFACGDLARARLLNGAVAYNGGGDPQYGTRIESALKLLGDLS